MNTFDVVGRISPELVRVVPKGWGYERWPVNGPLYCGKELVFASGKQCSYHYHKLKTETFLVASGQFLVRWHHSPVVPTDPDEISDEYHNAKWAVVGPGEVIHLPPLTRHQMYAYEPSTIIEFSTQHFDDDSYRLIKGD